MRKSVALLATVLTACCALPVEDPVISKLDPGQRYQHVPGPDGTLHLEDLWLKASDVQAAARFTPDEHIVYHLYTRQNADIAGMLLYGDEVLLKVSRFDPRKRTVVLIHGWGGSVTAQSNNVMIPAFLAAADVNLLVPDWNVGADVSYVSAVLNTPIAGEGIARFIDWLNAETGASLSQYHIVGHSLGGHMAGIVGRNVNGVVPYITSLDPALPAWITHSQRFRADDGEYTEVMHTNVGEAGFITPLGDVDFYPNGGNFMPGCETQTCHHNQASYYMAESVVSGGFTGRRCFSYLLAIAGSCSSTATLPMGGLTPKTGSTGVYHLLTNASPPYSLG